MLTNDAIERVTDANVTKFKEGLIAWFDTRATINKVETINLALESLKHRKEEDFRSYYNRTKRFLEETGGQNFQEKNPSSTLSTIKRSFSTG